MNTNLLLALVLSLVSAGASADPIKPWDLKQVTRLSTSLTMSTRNLALDAESEARFGGRRWDAAQNLRDLDREFDSYNGRLDRNAETRDRSLTSFQMVMFSYETSQRSFCNAQFSYRVERAFTRMARDLYSLNAFYGVSTRMEPGPAGPCWF